MNENEVKKIFNENNEDIAFIIGNGINRHYCSQDTSWRGLLLELWNQHSSDKKNTIDQGISLTEFYDALEIQNYNINNFNEKLQKDVKNKMVLWESNTSQNLILNKIKNLNSPILTTNFDDLIPRSLNLEFKRIKSKSFTDYYPWSCYYSDRDLNSPTEGFGVWYLNGMIKYHRSIRLGLSQYMGNVARARKLIHKNPENIQFEGKDQYKWPGYKTWLHIIFNKSLFIFGLGLGESEVFIRWLLIERAKYFGKFPNRKYNGWYIGKKTNNNEIIGKKFFLKSVGIEYIEVQDYEMIYQKIWA